MSKFVAVTVTLAALAAGGTLVAGVALASPPVDPQEPVLLDIPEYQQVGLRYLELRRDRPLRQAGPIDPPPGVRPVDPLSGGAQKDASARPAPRGATTPLGHQGGGPGFGFGGGSSSSASTSERSAEPALNALREVNRTLGY
jgi:hypothetical protein